MVIPAFTNDVPYAYDIIISLRTPLGDIGPCVNAVVSDVPGCGQQQITSVDKAMAFTQRQKHIPPHTHTHTQPASQPHTNKCILEFEV